jgi:DNA-binding MarR family transcriptional regulator
LVSEADRFERTQQTADDERMAAGSLNYPLASYSAAVAYARRAARRASRHVARRRTSVMSHPTARLDPLIHQPARLGILTVASETRRIDFVTLRDLLELTDGNLSRHLATLEDAGYVNLEKAFENKRPRTWISVTRAGRKALAAEIAALRDIVEPATGSSTAGGGLAETAPAQP